MNPRAPRVSKRTIRTRSFTQSRVTDWLPEALRASFGALVAAVLVTLAVLYDVIFLHPVQLCMRAPVMPMWNGSFSFLPWLFPRRSLAVGTAAEDGEGITRPREYQRSMFRSEQVKDLQLTRLRVLVERFTVNGVLPVVLVAGDSMFFVQPADDQAYLRAVFQARGTARSLEWALLGGCIRAPCGAKIETGAQSCALVACRTTASSPR